MKKRGFAAVMGAAIMAGVLTVSAATVMADTTWPDGTVELYVPAAAGGGLDITARVIAAQMQEDLGVGVSVVNQPDGSGVVGFESVRNAEPDGQKLLFYCAGIFSANISGIYDQDPAESFDNIAVIMPEKGYGGQGLFVRKDAPYDTFEEMIDYAKEHPGEVVFTAQTGGFSTFLIGAIEMYCDVQFNKVDGGGQADKLTAVAGGYADAMLGTMDGCMPYVESGEIKVLGVENDNGERMPAYPDIPNLAESFPDLKFSTDGYYILGPAGMDQEVKEAINSAVAAANDSEAVKESFAKTNVVYYTMTVDEAEAYLTTMGETMAEIGKVMGY